MATNNADKQAGRVLYTDVSEYKSRDLLEPPKLSSHSRERRNDPLLYKPHPLRRAKQNDSSQSQQTLVSKQLI